MTSFEQYLTSSNITMTSTPSSKSNNALLVCNSSECIKDSDKDALKCEKCKRSVHYRCTLLPAYQIQVIKSRKTHKYFCRNCVVVPQELHDLVPNRERSVTSFKTTKKVEQLQREIHGCEGIIKSHVEYESHLKEQLSKKDEDLLQLKNKLDNNPALHTLEYMEEKFEKKLDTFKESILASLEIEYDKFKQQIEGMKSYAEAASPNDTTFNVPTEIRHKTTLAEAIKSARMEEKAEENEKIRRAKNIIIHGVKEIKADAPTDDRRWVDSLVTDLHTHVNINRVSRIGKAAEGKNRPILVVLQSEEEKIKLMGNLTALKGIQDYQNISITEDLTPEDRKTLKTLSEQAKNHDRNDAPYILRVRGSSKNGFYLKKFSNNKN